MEIKKTVVLDGSESLSKALSQLDVSPAVIVTKNGKYLGIIDHRCLSEGIRDPHNVKCETLISKPPVLLQGAGVLECVDAFLLGHFKALPVLDEDKNPLGITTRVELLKEMHGANLIPRMEVSELMSSPAFTIDEDELVGAAKTLLKENKAHRLIVTRKGRPIGVLSSYDFGSWSSKTNLSGGRKNIRLSEPINVDGMRISGFLRPDVTLVKKGATIEDAAKRMIEKDVSMAIIVSDNAPLGVLAAVDVFKKIQDEIADGKAPIQVSGLHEDDAGFYPRIQSKIGHVLERFGKSFNIRNPSAHIKKGKSVYLVTVYVDTDEGHVSLKSERGSLQEAIDELAVELNEVLRKKKEMRRPKPRVTNAR